MPPQRLPVTRVPLNRLAVLAVITGVFTGLFVAGLNWAVIGVERLVYGTDHFASPSPAATASPLRLAVTFIVLGVLTSWAWYLLHRFGRPQVSVVGALQGRKMPFLESTLSAFLQVSTVAAGAPVGQENAPRLGGSLMAERFSSWLRLDLDAQRILVASAAGAGIGASFHLPLAGALFALEILLVEMSTRTVVITMLTTATAVATTGLLVETPPIFPTVQLTEAPTMLLAAVIIGVIAGLLGHWFSQAANRMVQAAPRGAAILWQMPAGFLVIAGIVYLVPQVAPNARWTSDTVLGEGSTLQMLLLIAVLRAFVILLAFRVGTVGGTLLPAFALGALVGGVVGTLLGPVLGITAGAFALLGAAAFLSTSMSAPLFGMIAAIEFTDLAAQGYLPVFIAVVAAALAVRGWGVITDREQQTWPMTQAFWTGEMSGGATPDAPGSGRRS